MDEEIAKLLFKGLEAHADLFEFDGKQFLNELVLLKIHESLKFSKVLSGKKQSLFGIEGYYEFSLRKVLRNKNAKDYQLSEWEKVYESIVNSLGAYSSGVLSKNLRSNETLVDLMAQCKEPYSLLGKLQFSDMDYFEDILFRITSPVLIIPGVKDDIFIYNWEKANTIYEKKIGSFGIFKKVKAEEYFSY